jgi:tetratricopeptide (TPR) repeat protein
MEKHLSKNWIWCGLIGLFTVLLWGQTVRFAFVWDDQIYITHNESLRSLANVPKFFYSMDAQSAERPSISYRPLRNTVYALLDALGGKAAPQPWIFHLANILWHAAVAMLLFVVALLMCERLAGGVSTLARIVSFGIALGFAANPVTSEVVCWAKCMDDLMAGVFVLASARSLLKWSPGARGYVAALVWFLLAVFSKESAVPFALVVFFILYGFHRLPRCESMKLTVPFLLVAFFYAAGQRAVMGRSSQCPPLSGSYAQTLIDMFPIGVDYLRLLLGIPPFCADYNFMVGAPPRPFFSLGVLSGVFLLLFFCALAAWLWRRAQWRLSAMGLLWVALFLMPVSNLVPMMQYMAERFLYLPLMGFLMALGGAALNFSRLRAAVAAAAVALVLIWSGTSLGRMEIWRDEVALFVGTELEHPGIKRVEQNAVGAVLRLPQIEASRAVKTLSLAEASPIIATLEKARQIFPENDALTTQLGVIEMKVGRLSEAVALLDLAVRQNPSSAERWYNLASIENLAGQPAKAREACAQALRLNPQHSEALRLQAGLEHDLKTAPSTNAPAPK